MFDFLTSPFSEDIGIDLGTANVLVYLKGKGILVREPSVVAIHDKTGAVLAVGEKAKRMVGKTPQSISAVRPLREGVISDFDVAEKMLRLFIKRVYETPSKLPRIFRPRVVIGIPSGITEVERKAVRDAALQSGARKVFLVEEPMAAAIGAGLPIRDPEGSLIVDVGGGTTEIAIISLGGVVVGKSLRAGGDKLTSAIREYVRAKYQLLLGEQTAERLKIEVGGAIPAEELEVEEPLVTNMRGRHLKTGLPSQLEFSAQDAWEALKPSLSAICNAIKDLVEATPPELLSDVLEDGITLVGGGSLLRGFDVYLSREVGAPVHTVKDPMSCVVRGCGKLLEDPELLEMVHVKD
ncbi:MAG: rod shape-determining protein [Patescibacteria group bacterium]|nr:rod shape-determining protein [Patescibacteria group bacterium]